MEYLFCYIVRTDLMRVDWTRLLNWPVYEANGIKNS